MVSELMLLADEYFLMQIIEESTHKHGDILDLMFTNNKDLIHSYTCNETIFLDHFIIEGYIPYKGRTIPRANTPNESTRLGPDLQRMNFFSETTDWNLMNQELSNHDWEYEFCSKSVEEMATKFIEVCTMIAEKYVPLKRRAQKVRNIIPRDRQNLMRRRNRIAKQLKNKITVSRKNKLKKEVMNIERKLKESYDNDRQTNERKAVLAIKNNNKYFYSYAKVHQTPFRNWSTYN